MGEEHSEGDRPPSRVVWLKDPVTAYKGTRFKICDEGHSGNVRPQKVLTGDFLGEGRQIDWTGTSPGPKPRGEEWNGRSDRRSRKAPSGFLRTYMKTMVEEQSEEDRSLSRVMGRDRSSIRS